MRTYVIFGWFATTILEAMASLTDQCSACKITFVPRGDAPAERCKGMCDACEAIYNERAAQGSALFNLTRSVLRKPVPFIKPNPPRADLKAKRKAFLRLVMQRTKALGLQAFQANKRVKSFGDYVELATVYAPQHVKRVLVLWMDMKVPWCVDYANRQYSVLDNAGAYNLDWICLHQDNFCNGSFGQSTASTTKLLNSMIETAGKPAAPCDLCTKPMLESVMCNACNKHLCVLCRDKWFQQCQKSGIPTTCPFCRATYEVGEMAVNLEGIMSDLKMK